MRVQKISLIAVACLVFGLTATILVAQQAHDDFSAGEVGAAAKLVVTSVSGPTEAIHNQTILVTYTVKNQGAVASGAYQVGLYLSRDKTIDPATARLLKNVTFFTGLAPGVSKKKTTKVLIPTNGLSGKYYYGAVVASSKKASSKQVSLVRYSLMDDNDTVKDHKTGLIWQQADDGIKRNWADAKKYCADLVLGGSADWRFPRVDELETIVDYSRNLPAIDPVFDSRSYFYWSGSTYAWPPNFAWYVTFAVGWVYEPEAKTHDYCVRCVRGGPFWPFDTSLHLEASSLNTVRDTYWGYMWQKGDSGDTPLTWVEANAYCDALELDDYTDWRLPEIEVLETIVNYTITDPALSPIFDFSGSYPIGSKYPYWSSSSTISCGPDGQCGMSNFAWQVSFTEGRVENYYKPSYGGYVRCVRGKPVSPGAPTGVTATAGNKQAMVIFKAPASDGGKPIISYTVTSNPGNINKSGASSPITVTELTNGTAYTFIVTATNAIGTSPASSPSNSVTPATVPGEPTGVTAMAGNAQATLTFMAPASDGGQPIISYTVTSNPGGKTATGGSSPITVTGLTNATAYNFTVMATNLVGTGPASSPSNIITPVDSKAFSVSGRVETSEGTGISGVAMTFSKVSGSVIIPATVTTDSNGNWNQSGFSNGATFRVTPSKVGYTFTPASRDFNAARSDLNFTSRFVNNWDGTVMDNATGLMWQKGDDGVKRHWADAVQYCANLALGGREGWLLPSLDELVTIWYPTIDSVFDYQPADYWTSTPDTDNPDGIRVVPFGNSGHYWANKTYSTLYARCVRGGP
jgi:hypothetical protein